MLRPAILIVIFLRTLPVLCQTSYPHSDLLLFSLTMKSDICSVEFKQSLIPNYSETYINQPYFFSDSIIYFNMLQKEFNTTEIYKCNIVTGNFTQSTFTSKISEFSPQPKPDRENFSVVRIEEDGKTQTLWSYSLRNIDKGNRLATWISNIGYYAWLDESEILAFLVDSVHQLKRINLKNKTEQLIALNPGRSLKKRNSVEHLFLDKSNREKYTLKVYNKSNGQVNTLLEWPFLTEDFDIFAEKYILASSKNELFLYNLETMGKWTSLTNVESLGYKSISRISVHPSGKLILVAHK